MPYNLYVEVQVFFDDMPWGMYVEVQVTFKSHQWHFETEKPDKLA
jgi:hypothetical protein